MPSITDLYFGGPVTVVLAWDDERKLHPFHVNGTGSPEGAITVTYNSGWNTQQYIHDQRKYFDEAAAKPEMLDDFTHWKFPQVVQKWDVSEGKGKPPIPLTTKALQPVSWELLRAILEGIEEDRHPKPKTPTS